MPRPVAGNVAERAQEIRDLKSQISELANDPDEQEIIFKETSPRRRRVMIYSMLDGEPLSIHASVLSRTLEKRLPDGGYMFTARENEAPEYKLGKIKCFLHSDSPERGVLSEIGLAGTVCDSAHLANGFSKRIHALHRHKAEWAAYQDYVDEEKERTYNERQERQLEATLAIAKQAGPKRGVKNEEN